MTQSADEFWRDVPMDDRFIVAYEEAKAVVVKETGEELVLIKLGNIRDGDRVPLGLMIRKDYALAMAGGIANAIANLEWQRKRL